jgi:3-hydroxyisobutyrate dehydrogenase-like beta-hydroxyacid dehydrogenase
MAQALIAGGFDVTGYDVRPEAVEKLQASGGSAGRSVEEAARDRDAVVIMVRTPDQAEEVVLGRGGTLERARPGAVLAVMSTIGVGCVRRLGTAARERGFRFLDAPVSGGPARAHSRTLTIIVGGSSEDLATAAPMLGTMGAQIEHVGDIGAATAVKMANQVSLTISLLAAREVSELVRAQGVSTERLWEVLRTCTGTTWVVENWTTVAPWLDGSHPATLDILVKDTGLAQDLVRDLPVPARLVPLSAELVRELATRLAR